MPDRLCLQGILFVLYTGIAWQHRSEVRVASAVRSWSMPTRAVSSGEPGVRDESGIVLASPG